MNNRKNPTGEISLVLCIFFLFFSSSAFAQTVFTVAIADGYAAGTTGGGNAGPVTVTNPSDFKIAIDHNSAAVIIVSGNLDVGAVKIKSNTTIIGADSSSTLTGNLSLSGVSNIIIQNLNITNKSGAGSGDGIEASDGCTKIFVHKCTFIDCKDGSFDIKRGTTNVTVSWCRFLYPTRTSHCFPNLIGHSDTNGDQDRGKLHVTMHHNWYDKGCKQRMPRVRFGQVHVYNNFYSGPLPDLVNDYTIGVGEESSILLENSYFESITNTWWEWTKNVQGKIEWKDLCLVNTEASAWAENSDVFDPPYTYSLNNSCDVKSIVTNITCGAGNCGTDSCGVPTTPMLGLISGPASQTVTAGMAITSIIYTWGGSATDVNISGLPAGLDSSKDTITKTITISGTPVATGTFTITTLQSSGNTVSLSGTITVVEPSGFIPGKSEPESTQLFPNPIGHSFQIKGFEGKATVRIFDLNGKLLLTKDVLSNEIIMVDELPGGMYIVKIASLKGIAAQKIFKK